MISCSFSAQACSRMLLTSDLEWALAELFRNVRTDIGQPTDQMNGAIAELAKVKLGALVGGVGFVDRDPRAEQRYARSTSSRK